MNAEHNQCYQKVDETKTLLILLNELAAGPHYSSTHQNLLKLKTDKLKKN